MLDENLLECLQSYRFDLVSYPKTTNPYLLNSSRMGYAICSSGFKINRNKNYPYFSLHIIVDGFCSFSVNGMEHLLKKGDAFIVTSQPHSYRNTTASNLKLLWIEISGNGSRELLNYFQLNNIHAIDSKYTSKITNQLVKILLYVKDHSVLSPYELSAMQYSLIMDLMEVASLSPYKNIPPIITNALNYINENFMTTIRICDLADSMNVSSTYLTSQFHKYFNTSPYQYIKLKRLEYACYLLNSTNLSCQEIAEQSGFYDAAHFHRVFMKNMNMSPAQYHKNTPRSDSPNPIN